MQNGVYVGFGSAWFTDFVLAHEILDILDMVSMEVDDIGFARALYNAPYATVQVRKGSSNKTLPELLLDQRFIDRPWVVWLDYNCAFDETVRDDVKVIIEGAPANSTLVVTFNAHEGNYGAARDRPKYVQGLFGSVVSDDLSKRMFKSPKLQSTLARLAIDFMRSASAAGRRHETFVDTVELTYRDNSPMVTVGGMLSAPEKIEIVKEEVKNAQWRCKPDREILAPHLTIREALAIQAMLPRAEALTREEIQESGFDLEVEKIQVYQRYYREYPSFVEVRT